MFTGRLIMKITLIALLLGVSLCAAPAFAAVDSLVQIVSGPVATGGSNSIASFGYDPIGDVMYVSSFGAGGSLRKVVDVSTNPVGTTVVFESSLQLYYRDGDADRGVGSPMQSGISFNPLPIVNGNNVIAPYSMAIIADASTTYKPGFSSGTANRDPAASKRFYTYNRGELLSGGNASAVYTTIATMADLNNAAGVPLNTTTNNGRQVAWSGNGQWAYFGESSADHGGIWKLDPLTGDMERLVTGDANTEPAVVHNAGVDTIFFRGIASTGNVGGIDKITYDGTTASAASVAVSIADLRSFLEADSTMTPTIFAMSSDSEGNVYFSHSDSTPERRGIFKLDTEGRLAKVATQAERNQYLTELLGATTAANSNTLRMQPRTIQHPTAGAITQILYAENATNGVTGVNVFKTGDFDRNGVAGQAADMSQFSAALKVRGAAITNVDNHKFDLNANAVVDWKDVKILQQFVDLPNGDANFDGVLDLVDLDVVGANYYTASPTANKTWATGDFASVDPLYATTAVDANIVNLVDLQLFADTWLNVLDQPITKTQLTSRGYVGQFLDDVLDVFGFNTALAGDFDLNGVVDGADFLAWQRQFGTNVTPGTGADADGDGLVDGDDLAVWQGNFGATAAAPVAAAVPEPSALLLGTLAVAGVAGLRRRQSVR
ncbi:hypothetical protein [Lacipirellula parvula]|uniref:PEP-CTERM protein-sorting domain-containing protein n=1 Tax=Lacipirellula parvula TaxID=2650471 RepID=A0A5K7XDQ6_9BACT|nr:hypothetical protein [Lacipirellula parvula]BBO31159.1 hypothetical protein PLANPX_0771 [Lacipirellula parvula]